MPRKTASDALRGTLAILSANAYTASRTPLGPLHEKVCDVVDELKAAGMKPEAVILRIKGIASESPVGTLSTALVDKMVTWCLEEYFKESPAA